MAQAVKVARVGKYDVLDQAHISNTVGCVLQATQAELEAGRAWYPSYATSIIAVANEHGLSAAQGIAVFAAISPMMPIARNWTEYVKAVTTKDGHAIGHTMAVRATVAAILAGDVSALSGIKVTSFAANLSGDYNRVTVDRHAVSMVYGTMIDAVKGDSQYRYCERAIQAAAVTLGMSPAECQAVGWVVWRRLKGIVDAPRKAR